MSEMDRKGIEEAQRELVERFFPSGVPQAGALTEEVVRSIIREVAERIRQEGAAHVPEDPGMSEEVLRYVHTV